MGDPDDRDADQKQGAGETDNDLDVIPPAPQRTPDEEAGEGDDGD